MSLHCQSLSSEWLTVSKSGKRLQTSPQRLENTSAHVWQNNAVLQRGERNVSQRGVVCLSVCLLVSHFTVCWWDRHRYGFTRLGRARPRCWQQVLFDVDVPCWVSALASTYDLNYDQRRDACWWMTSGSRKTGERVLGGVEDRWIVVEGKIQTWYD